MLIVLGRQICGRKGYPDSFSERMDLWKKVTHMCIKKCSKGRAPYISTGISLLFIGLLDCPRKNHMWKSNKWHLWFIHANLEG